MRFLDCSRRLSRCPALAILIVVAAPWAAAQPGSAADRPADPAVTGLAQAAAPTAAPGRPSSDAAHTPPAADANAAQPPAGPYPGNSYSPGPYPGGPYRGGPYPGGRYPGGRYPGGAYPGGAYPGGAYPGGAYPGGAYPGARQPGAYGPSNGYQSQWFQRPYPYHLDYYRMRYGGSYAPYFGNLYGPPAYYFVPTYPYYGDPYYWQDAGRRMKDD